MDKYRREEDGGTLKAQLAWRKKCIATLTATEWKRAVTKIWWKHYLVIIKTFALYTMTLCLLVKFQNFTFIWVPLGFLQGCWLFAIAFMTHECGHYYIFQERSSLKDAITNWSARFYGCFVINSVSFARTVHSRHHHHFFKGELDPKVTYFIPKDDKALSRWMYILPGGFRAIMKWYVKTFAMTPEGKRAISERDKIVFMREFKSGIILHALVSGVMIMSYGVLFWVKVYLLPHQFWFPVAFMFNRCGQHYCCNPKDAALQTTNVIGHWFWDAAMAYGEYHLEHHIFPEVPSYNLPALNKILRKRVYARERIPQFYLSQIIYNWYILNKPVFKVWYEIAVPYSQTETAPYLNLKL